MLSSFYLGCGGFDISCIMSLVGIDHGMWFYQTFNRYSKEIEAVLGKVTGQFHAEAIFNELFATLKEQDGNLYSGNDMNEIYKMIRNKEYEDLF